MPTETFSFIGQMWRFKRGNQEIVLENAYAFKAGRPVTMERIHVNGEVVHDYGPKPRLFLLWRTMYMDEFFTEEGLVEFKLQWTSGLRRVKARLLVGDEEYPWTEVQDARWDGPLHTWPNWTHPISTGSDI